MQLELEFDNQISGFLSLKNQFYIKIHQINQTFRNPVSKSLRKLIRSLVYWFIQFRQRL